MKNLFAAACMVGLVSILCFTAMPEERVGIVPDGEYLGRQEMANLTPEDPDAAWFHENTLLVRNGEAILDEVPIVVQHGKKGYSASDGGFLTFRVKFLTEGGQNSAAMRLCESDYLMFPKGKHDEYTEIKTYPVRIFSDKIEIGSVEYHRTRIKKIELDRLLRLLRTEPLQKIPEQ
jgi:hypothetical protein